MATQQRGHDEAVASYEKELADYLVERIRPGLNRGAIPLLARSIAKEIAHREHPNGAAGADDESTAEGDDVKAQADEDYSAEAEDEQPEAEDEQVEPEDEQAEDEERAEEDEDEERAEEDEEESADDEAVAAFEDEMHTLQADLGEDWIVRFSVQGDDAWLTAEKDDGSQRLEAPTAEVLIEAVELINEAGGRSG